MGDEVSFTGANYVVCNYCTSLIRGMHRDGSNDGCKQIQNTEGKYARINTLGEYVAPRLRESGTDFVDGETGCEKFESNGVPAHPKALERLVDNNSKCASILSDINALETSWDFYAKVSESLPGENIVDSREVQ